MDGVAATDGSARPLTSRRSFWIVVGLLFWAFTLWTAFTYAFPAGRDDAADVAGTSGLAGTYVVNGVDITGTEYSGTVVIVDDGSTIELEYIVGPIQTGVGTRTGSVLEVVWRGSDVTGDEVTGTATYTIFDDGHLEGQRRVDGVEGVGTEELFLEP